MTRIKLLFVAFLMVFTIYSCSKKIHPSKKDEAAAIKDSIALAKKTPVKKIKTAVPKVIVVNDAAAKKSGDGRLYYDLQGRRYWRNYKDGKYYLFNKSMYNDDAFKPVNKN
ncbi:MAG TPA: hypothetical protein VK489_06010 [Ferruginibacter sp.]|nr:hypothetical protein [Ferruginibacter sp.]